MRRLIRRTFFLLFLIGVGGYAYSLYSLKPSETEGPLYRYAKIERGDITRYVTASGSLSALTTVEVSSQLSGQIAQLFVKHNEVVTAEQPLAMMDDEIFQARVLEARANLANAEASYEASQAVTVGTTARFDEAKADYDRKQPLRSRGTISVAEFDRSKRTMDAADSDLRVALADEKVRAATIQTAEAALIQADITLKRTTIRSPIGGIVIGISVDLGQTVAASLQAPTLFTIVGDLSEMKVETFIDETEIGLIQQGQRAVFRVSAYPERVFEGEVQEVRKAPRRDQNVVTYTTMVSVSNPEGLLLPGMTAEVRLIVSERQDVLKVPNAALRFEPKESAPIAQNDLPNDGVRRGRVWVRRKDDRLEPAVVTVGYSDNSYTEISADDLKKGQEIVVGYAASEQNSDLFDFNWRF